MQAVHSSAVGVRHEAQTRSGIQRIGGAAGVIFGVVDISVAAILIVSAILLKLGLTEENHLHRRVGAVLAFLRDEAAERHA